MTPEIEGFARKLIEQVRDAAIRSSDADLRPTAASPAAKRWHHAARDESPLELARVVIPDVVDETVFYLLQAIDEGLLPLSFASASGRSVDLTAEGRGELAGWYMGSGGWRAMYATERFVDDFSDLRWTDS